MFTGRRRLEFDDNIIAAQLLSGFVDDGTVIGHVSCILTYWARIQTAVEKERTTTTTRTPVVGKPPRYLKMWGNTALGVYI